MKPIQTKWVIIKKCDQLKNRLLVAIDGEEHFTKVLFLNKTNKEQLFNEDDTSLMLELSLFYTQDFEYAMEWIREKAYISHDIGYNIHITGLIALKHQNKISSIFKRDVFYMEESVMIATGCKFALNYIGIQNLLAKGVEGDIYKESVNENIIRMRTLWKNRFTEKKYATDAMHPCIFFVQGSSSAIFYFDENGICQTSPSQNSGSETFLGLSKCLLNTNNLNEVLDLASKGNRDNLSTLIRDIMDQNINLPHQKLSPEMLLFPFGKCMDTNQDLKDLSKEDIAISLVILQIHYVIAQCTAICYSNKVEKVYVSGGLFESELVRRELKKILSVPFITINAEILNFDYSAVLGAMVFDGNSFIKNY